MSISKKHFNKIASLINRNLISGEGTINDKLIVDLGLYFANENKNFNSTKWCMACYNVKINDSKTNEMKGGQ